MSDKTISFGGMKIRLDVEKNRLNIAGRDVNIQRTNSGGYTSDLLPYHNVRSLEQLGKLMVTHLPKRTFRGKKN